MFINVHEMICKEEVEQGGWVSAGAAVMVTRLLMKPDRTA